MLIKETKNLTFYTPETIKDSGALFFDAGISAGFPSPAEDFMENKMNLNDYVIKNPHSSYLVKVSGDSMIGAGIFDGDILVVDRSISATNNRIVIAMIDGDFLVKRLRIYNNAYYLIAESSRYAPIEVKDKELTIWGVVTYSIHKPQ